MSNPAVCWRCGASLAALTLPLSRLDYCRQCRAELHACKQCLFYDVTVAKHCREPIAEEVRDKERANYCDYFAIRNDAWRPASAAAQQARAHLDAVFGKSGAAADAPDSQPSAEAAARAALNDLFGKS